MYLRPAVLLSGSTGDGLRPSWVSFRPFAYISTITQGNEAIIHHYVGIDAIKSCNFCVDGRRSIHEEINEMFFV